MDLSAIVPAGAKAIAMTVHVGNTVTGINMAFRKKGNSNTFNTATTYGSVAGYNYWYDIVVPCDSNRFIQYIIESASINLADVVIKGWWS